MRAAAVKNSFEKRVDLSIDQKELIVIFFSKKLCKGEYRLAKYEWKIETEMFGSLIFSFTSFFERKEFFQEICQHEI